MNYLLLISWIVINGIIVTMYGWKAMILYLIGSVCYAFYFTLRNEGK